MKKIILGIETSCDETALALVEASGGLEKPRFKILKDVVASQIKVHRPFGGVVPNLAKREHIKNLPILFKKIGGEKIVKKVDLIAVTMGPGLEPALWAGITFAKEIAEKYKKPLAGANHLEGHLYSFLLPKKSKTKPYNKKSFPCIGLIVSGGHTTLLLLKDLKTRKRIGETRDDAVGEAFDKVARILELPYPGGPEIEKIARKGNLDAINFPRPMMRTKDYDFSFSGLKTAVLYYVRDFRAGNFPSLALAPTSDSPDGIFPAMRGRFAPGKISTRLRGSPLGSRSGKLPSRVTADIAASFQKAAVETLVYKTMRAVKEYGARSVALSGGVAANKSLRKELEKQCKKYGIKFLVADFKYNTDNAVMIAASSYLDLLRKKRYPLVARGSLNV